MKKRIRSTNLRDQVYDIVRDMIVSHELRPGQKIFEEQIAAEIGVSRTPVREALFRLENDGIVEIIPRRGPFVVALTEHKIVEILLIREVLEGLVARLATPLITPARLKQLRTLLDGVSTVDDDQPHLTRYTNHDITFHKTLLEACDNQMLTNMMGPVNSHLSLIRLRTVAVAGRARQTVAEHYGILEAMEAKDAPLAEQRMRAHITSVRASAMENIAAML